MFGSQQRCYFIFGTDAVKERLIREIMAKDEVDWDKAKETFTEIEKANMSGMLFHTFPYKVMTGTVPLDPCVECHHHL
jgi:hypothetical protein